MDRRKELSERFPDACYLSLPAGGARVSQDCSLPGQDRHVLHESGVRIAQVGWQLCHRQTTLLQRLAIALVLPKSQSNVGSAQTGGRQTLGKIFAWNSDDGMLEHQSIQLFSFHPANFSIGDPFWA